MTSARRGMMFILSSPSGAGKTTLSRRLLERYQQGDDNHSLVLSISVTTRKQRPGEEEGRDYFFVSREQFESMVLNGELLEHAEVFGNCYGTPNAFVKKHIDNGIDVLFDIDWQGTRQLAEKRRADMVSVFILPPSMSELERRLYARAQDSKEVVDGRMSKAASEISHWEEYDYVLVNDNLEATLDKVEAIFKAERMKRLRQEWLKGFVKTLVG